MRKILLGTTGVVAAALIGMGAAQAQQAPTVRVGGFMVGVFQTQDDSAEAGLSRASHDFRNELEVQVFVTGKAANGLSYGAVIELQNDNTGAGSGSTIDVDEAFIFVSTPTLGTIRFGEEDDAGNLLQVRVPAVFNHGPDADFDDMAGGVSLMDSLGGGVDSTKIIYLSPQFAGFDFGLSYAPNGGEGDRALLGRNADGAQVAAARPNQRDEVAGNPRDMISAGLRYRGTLGGVGVAAGVGMLTAKGGAPTDRDTNAYTVGLNISAFGLVVGGEYTWGEYSGGSPGRTPLAAGRDDSKHYVIGATYTIGAIQLGAFYGEAEQDRGNNATREQTVYGVGAVYNVAPGLDIFANYTDIEDKQATTRSLTSFIVGTRLAF